MLQYQNNKNNLPSPYRGYQLSTDYRKYLQDYSEKAYKFPSPYRGCHLSTSSAVIKITGCPWFPSPYRGYHLSTVQIIIATTNYYDKVSVPLSGLSSFNRVLRCSANAWNGFRPLIGVIIFQRYKDIFKNRMIGKYVSVPLSGLSSFNDCFSFSSNSNSPVSVPLSGLSSFNYIG